MDQNEQTESDNQAEQDNDRREEAVAKAAVHRIGREERLWDRAEGRLWLQCLPILFIAAAVILFAIAPLRPVLAVAMLVAPFVLIQIALWSTGKRQDAMLELLRDQYERDRK